MRLRTLLVSWVKCTTRVPGDLRQPFIFRPRFYDTDPVYEQGFVFLVVNPHSDDLHIKILDSGHKNANIGSLVIRMSDLFNQPNLEFTSQPFPLNGGGPHASITLAAQLRCLKKPRPKPIEAQKSVSIDDVNLPKSLKAEKSLPAGLPDPTPASEVSLPSAEGAPEHVEEQKIRSPSLDEMLASTLEPILKPTGNDLNLTSFLNPLTDMRHRAGVFGPCGKVKIGLLFDAKRDELKVTVYEAKGLPGRDLPDPPDPYVKLYLLPGWSIIPLLCIPQQPTCWKLTLLSLNFFAIMKKLTSTNLSAWH